MGESPDRQRPTLGAATQYKKPHTSQKTTQWLLGKEALAAKWRARKGQVRWSCLYKIKLVLFLEKTAHTRARRGPELSTSFAATWPESKCLHARREAYDAETPESVAARNWYRARIGLSIALSEMATS